MTDGAGTVTYAYDDLDRLTKVTRGSNAFTYGYDDVGNITSRTYPDGLETTYSYDGDERLATAAFGGNTVGYGYDAAGNLIRMTRPAENGWTETRAYDHAGRLIQIEDANGSSTLQRLDYAYDAVGDMTSAIGLSGSEYYEYDDRDRLTEVCYSAPYASSTDTIGWTYDGVGNRLTETRSTAGTTAYSYDAADELTRAQGPGGTTAYTYDANGDQATAGSTTYTYDLADRLSSATVDGATTSYSYDGDGNRLTSTTGTATTDYLWDTNDDLAQLATETDGSGTTLRDYIQGLDTVALIEGGSTYYYHHNAIGSVTALTTADGSKEWTYSYEPFGNPRTLTQNDPDAPVNPLRYAGQYLDPDTGLYDLRARQYDPTAGLFTSTDPTPAGPTTPYNATYDYAGENPTDQVDPSGTEAIPVPPGTLLGGGLLITLAAGADQCIKSGACSSGTSYIIKKAVDALWQSASDAKTEQGDNEPTPPGYDPKTWRKGKASRPSVPEDVYWDPSGGEWRWHPPDPHHPDAHWDYNPHDTTNSPWQNVYPKGPAA